MGVVKLSTAGILDYQKYSSMLAGNTAFIPSSYDLLETQVLSSDASSVTFTGLGSYTDYKHLQIRATLRTSYTAVSNGLIRWRANGDSGYSYSVHYLFGNGSAASSSYQQGTNIPTIGITTTSADSAGIYSVAIMDILDFSSTNKYKTLRISEGRHGDSNSTNIGLALRSSLWHNTNALTSLQFYDGRGYDWVAGCRFSLYGVKVA